MRRARESWRLELKQRCIGVSHESQTGRAACCIVDARRNTSRHNTHYDHSQSKVKMVEFVVEAVKA